MEVFFLIFFIAMVGSVISAYVKNQRMTNRDENHDDFSTDEDFDFEDDDSPSLEELFGAFIPNKAQSVNSPKPSPKPPVIEKKKTEDCCMGGSIHDGYHEGTVGVQGVAVPKSSEGKSLNETVNIEPESEHGSDKLSSALSEKPSIVQGVIWAEILGKPKGEL